VIHKLFIRNLLIVVLGFIVTAGFAVNSENEAEASKLGFRFKNVGKPIPGKTFPKKGIQQPGDSLPEEQKGLADQRKALETGNQKSANESSETAKKLLEEWRRNHKIAGSRNDYRFLDSGNVCVEFWCGLTSEEKKELWYSLPDSNGEPGKAEKDQLVYHLVAEGKENTIPFSHLIDLAVVLRGTGGFAQAPDAFPEDLTRVLKQQLRSDETVASLLEQARKRAEANKVEHK
jgi:hypothetical protein